MKLNNTGSGILFFILFVIVLGGAFASSTRNVSGLSNLLKDIKSGFEKERIENIFTQSIIEEESAIIDVVEKASPAVVSVFVKSLDFDPFFGPLSDEPEGIGTGFIVDPNGIIITNSHVVFEEGAEYSIVLRDGTSYDVEKVHLDPVDDLAILEVSARDLPTVELGISSNLKVGQKAIAIGNALGQFSNTVTVGVVSGLGRQVTASGPFGTNPKSYTDVIQTDAAINPGNSGGPLLNVSGQVIGVNVATSRGADNISFAIPVDHLRPILESFRENGRIIRPFLGVNFNMITEDLARLRRLPEGAYITRVGEDTPAEKAGLQRGDIITKINGRDIDEKNPLDYEIQQRHEVGDRVNLTVDRDGEILEISAILEEAPSTQ